MGRPTCLVDDCEKPAASRGWCGKHYMRWRTHGDPNVVLTNQGNFRHGNTSRANPNGSATYRSWHAMRQRIRDTNTAYAHRYVERGINCDPRWDDYSNFLADMGERPPNPDGWTSRKSYWSLDRIDNDKGYGPGNCRWASSKEQQRNRTVKLTKAQVLEIRQLRDLGIQGKVLAPLFGVSVAAIYQAAKRAGRYL